MGFSLRISSLAALAAYGKEDQVHRSLPQSDSHKGLLWCGAATGLAVFLLLAPTVTVAFATSRSAHSPVVQSLARSALGFSDPQAQTGNATPTPTVASSPVVTETLTSTTTATASPMPTVITSPVAPLTSTPPPATTIPTAIPTATWTAMPSPTASATQPAAVAATPSPVLAVSPWPTTVAIVTSAPGTTPRGSTIAMALGFAVLLLAAAVIGAALILSRPRQRAPQPKAEPQPPQPSATPDMGGQAAPVPGRRALLSPVRPPPGVCYLESRGRPAGILYCPLEKPVVTIGRDPESDLVVDASFDGWQTVSHRHATVECDGGRAIVVDQQSHNGVYVNNRRTGANVLCDGWTVRFGKVEFIFHSSQGGGAL